MAWSSLVTAWVGDIHLGHRNTPTLHILANLERILNDDLIKRLDILFIEGDVFDRLLTLDAEPVSPIRIWMANLLLRCKKHNTRLRMVKGTPSHDWGQMALFPQVNEELGIGADLRYFDEITIDVEDDGLTVLYMPDEARPTPQESQAVVEQLMKRQGLTQIDVACMHGFFAPQQHTSQGHNAFDLAFYPNVVTYAIGIGHVHKRWQHLNIVASGSFDRIAHSEEDPKGISVITLTKGKPLPMQVEFIENINARKYVSVDCRDKPLEKAKDKVIKTADKLPANSAIRIIARPDEAIAQAIPHFASLYPQLNWTRVFKDKADTVTSDEQLVELVPIEKTSHVFSITQDNVVALLKARPAFTQGSLVASQALSELEKRLAS